MIKLAGCGQKILQNSFRGILNLESRILNPGASSGGADIGHLISDLRRLAGGR
jgi:hypothetical protein